MLQFYIVYLILLFFKKYISNCLQKVVTCYSTKILDYKISHFFKPGTSSGEEVVGIVRILMVNTPLGLDWISWMV